MFTIDMKLDLSELERELPKLATDRIPSITRNALNDTAKDMVEAERAKIKGVFDGPTPFTQRAVVFPQNLRATKTLLEAEIVVNDDYAGKPASYLRPQIFGGPRPPKRFETLLRNSGIMAPDEFATIAIGYRRNAYGNIPGPTLVAILSQLKSFAEVGFKANETKSSKKRAGKKRVARYFVPRDGSGLRRGVYERVGKRIRAVLIFVRQPVYRARYDFGQAAEAKAVRVFGNHFFKHLAAEVAKATTAAIPDNRPVRSISITDAATGRSMF